MARDEVEGPDARPGVHPRKGRLAAVLALLWAHFAAQAAPSPAMGAIAHLDAIRNRLLANDQAAHKHQPDSLLGIESGRIDADLGSGLVAQWGNWPNWGNWANWNNWNNWGNWRNF
jgi:hypothetical protein